MSSNFLRRRELRPEEKGRMIRGEYGRGPSQYLAYLGRRLEVPRKEVSHFSPVPALGVPEFSIKGKVSLVEGPCLEFPSPRVPRLGD